MKTNCTSTKTPEMSKAMTQRERLKAAGWQELNAGITWGPRFVDPETGEVVPVAVGLKRLNERKRAKAKAKTETAKQ